MENVVLKMNYRGESFDVRVDDTDRVLLIDVLNDMVDEAEKQGKPLPTNPILTYSYMMKSVEIKDDRMLMEMFSRWKEKRVFNIYVGTQIYPSHALLMARKVRANKKTDNAGNTDDDVNIGDLNNDDVSGVHIMDKGKGKLQVRRAPKAIPTHVTSQLTLRRSPRKIATQSSQVESCPNTSNSPATERFTQPTHVAENLTLPRRRSLRLTPNPTSQITQSLDEGSYIPSDDEDVNDMDDELTDLEVEDNSVLSSLNFIDDGYVPFDENKWVDDEGGFATKMYNNGEIYDDKEFGSIRLRPWMLFMDKEHFKDVVRDFCIQEGFYVIVLKADNSRYTAECATANCNWRIHASVLLDGTTWAIKSIDNPAHGCVGVKSHNPMANSVWVARKLIEDIRANPDISGKSIQSLLQERYGIEMKTSTIYRMKEIAMTEINGGHDESYKKLPAYCEMIKKTNPESYAICSWVEMETPERPMQFKSIFVSFTAQFKGVIAGCRSLIGVDGTHLKGNHGGVLLAAVALDGNNELFPIAVAVVESENKDSWSSFFWHLKECIKESQRNNWTIICDRQKGVEPALESVWPEAYRRFCARHLCKNFKKDYPGILMHKLFWRVVNATSEYSFKKAMETVVHHGGLGCARWFLDLGDKEQWAKHKFDPSISSDENTSNFVESFNSTLGAQRLLPILSLLEGVRRVSMVRHATRQHVADSWPDDGICPNIRKLLSVLKKDSRACTTFESGRGDYEIRDGRSFLLVSLVKKECACGLWQISGIPCKHAIRAIIFDNRDPLDFVSEWFYVRVYKEAYGLSISHIPDLEQ
ncbi:hypothetical protein KSS87_000571 [Heliosperma pusillum]|nr:hypothetical protein KSS87_000571 [Heliosperma pusillum]